MIAILPFCKADTPAALRLLKWISQLGGCKKHTALLVADCEVQWSDATQALKLAKLSFLSVKLITTEKPCDYPWPTGANLMFLTGANAVNEPFFWLEPDAVPLKRDWLDTIEEAYRNCGKMFMGPVLDSNDAALPKRYMAGTAVYPCNAGVLIEKQLKGGAWDMDAADMIVPRAAHTDLIHHLWGEKNNPPVFAETNIPGTNVFCPKQIHPEAVVFHRNKDGSLIRMLSGQTDRDLIVVISFCEKDAFIAQKNLEWINKLSGKQAYDLVLAYDQTAERYSQPIENIAIHAFRSVQKIRYHLKERGWPQAPNLVFQMIARHMQGIGRPWLWLEPDAIPIKPDWLNVLKAEYLRARRPFMGAIVPQMGHMNGVGIYPANTPELIPTGMRATSGAWDTEMRQDMIGKCHDAGHLIQHCWGIHNGCAHPHTGDLPHFRSRDDVNKWLLPSAVLFHRCKDGSLIDQLQS